jgi:hypothetical protein
MCTQIKEEAQIIRCDRDMSKGDQTILYDGATIENKTTQAAA